MLATQMVFGVRENLDSGIRHLGVAMPVDTMVKRKLE
jgi:hypothetical protein